MSSKAGFAGEFPVISQFIGYFVFGGTFHYSAIEGAQIFSVLSFRSVFRVSGRTSKIKYASPQ